MSKKNSNAIVVAHPDDETLFFSGLILASPDSNWTIVCATDGNADGNGALRKKQFQQATELLNCKTQILLDLPDIYEERLDQKVLSDHLASLDAFDEIYTHSPIGDYGHPHHQDVSFAVHKYYFENLNQTPKVWSIAYNASPDKFVQLNSEQFKLKCKILSEIYFDESNRLIQFLPATAAEEFCQISFNEVAELYRYLSSPPPFLAESSASKIDKSKLQKYKWFSPFLESYRDQTLNRPF